MLVYISGQITGNPDYQKDFAIASEEIIMYGHAPVNPANIVHPGWSYKQYIDRDLILLSMCDAIYMLRGWERSKGARLENEYAKSVGMAIIYQSRKKRWEK